MKKVLLLFLLFTVHYSLFTAQAQCTAVSITTQPQNQNDSIPGAAHFNVTVTGTAPFNYYWYKNGVVVDSTITSASATNNYNTPPLTMADSSNTYYCIITNCLGLNSVTSNTVHLICIPVSISIQPLSQTFAAGVVTTISFSVTVNGTPPFSYYWYAGSTLVQTTLDTIGHTSIYSFLANPVVYGMNGNAYHVVISNYCNGGGGGGSGVNTVVSGNAVVSVNCPTMAAPQISGPMAACGGPQNLTTIQLSTATITGATYNWTLSGGGFSSSLQSPSVTIYQPLLNCYSVFNFLLTVTLNGCSSNGTWQTYLYAEPYLNNPPSNQTICSGGTVSYIPSVWCGYISNISHSVTSCITGFSTIGYPNINDVLINNGTVPCSVTYHISLSNAGCFYGPTYNFTVTVNPSPNVTVNSPTICSGQTATLTASGNATSYTWAGGASSTGVNTAGASPATTSTYTVIGTNACGTDSAFATVTVNPVPIVSVTSPSICVGETATLEANGADTYAWSAGATPVNTDSATASPTSTSTYTVTGTNSFNCSSTAISTVTVNIINNGITQTIDTLTSNQTGATYQWYECVVIGLVPIAGATNQSYVATSNGQYAVSVSLGNCIDTSACMNFYYVGGNELGIRNYELGIYPNPTTGELGITNYELGIKKVSIYNILGECILSQQPTTNNPQLTFDLRAFAKGIYFVEIVTKDSQIERKKIVLQ